MLRPLVGSPLPGDPVALIAPTGTGGPAIGVGALPDDAQICSCNNVTKARRCVRPSPTVPARSPTSKAAPRRAPPAASCVPLLPQLLAAEGVEVSTALCEHFSQSRAELFEIVQASGIRTFSGLIERYGTGTGCDICKPAVASILASTSSEHILDGEQASLQDTNDHFLANLQRNGTYSVVPRVPGGDITAEQLILIGEIARDFGLYTKITGGQRIDMFGATVDQLPQIWLRLVEGGMESGHAYGKSLRTVKSCVGTDWCRYGQQDSVANGHRPRTALPRPTRAPQNQNGRLRVCPRMRRSPRQRRRRDRHRSRLEPLRRRQRRHDTQTRPTTGLRPRQPQP